MAFAWREEAERNAQAAKIPAGVHRLRIAKTVHGNNNGPFRSRNGDPQVLVIFQDREAREAGTFLTLSERAAWTLARLLGSCDPPANLARMEQDGIEPIHFANPEFAAAQLGGRTLTAEVEYERGDDGKEYARVTPLKPALDAPPSTPVAPAANAAPRPTVPSPASEPPPSAIEAAPAVDDLPPPVAPPPPSVTTKDEAWAYVLKQWDGNGNPNAKDMRNEAWRNAVAKMGKPEQQFTPQDWATVADRAGTPF